MPVPNIGAEVIRHDAKCWLDVVVDATNMPETKSLPADTHPGPGLTTQQLHQIERPHSSLAEQRFCKPQVRVRFPVWPYR